MKLKHEAHYPVVGGAAQCIHCGKQAYDADEICFIKVMQLEQELANVKHYTIEFLEMLDDQKNFCTKDIMIARAKLEQAIKEE